MLNKKQIAVLWLGVLIIVGMCLPSCIPSYSTHVSEVDIVSRMLEISAQYRAAFRQACVVVQQNTRHMNAHADPNSAPVEPPSQEERDAAEAIFEQLKRIGLLASEEYPPGIAEHVYVRNLRAMAMAQLASEGRVVRTSSLQYDLRQRQQRQQRDDLEHYRSLQRDTQWQLDQLQATLDHERMDSSRPLLSGFPNAAPPRDTGPSNRYYPGWRRDYYGDPGPAGRPLDLGHSTWGQPLGGGSPGRPGVPLLRPK